MCDISAGDVVAVWGAGPVGQFARDSARVLGAEKVIAIDKEPYRLDMAAEAGYLTIDFKQNDVRSTRLETDRPRQASRQVPKASTRTRRICTRRSLSMLARSSRRWPRRSASRNGAT